MNLESWIPLPWIQEFSWILPPWIHEVFSEPWILNPSPWNLGSWILNPTSLDSRSFFFEPWILNPESYPLGIKNSFLESWILNPISLDSRVFSEPWMLNLESYPLESRILFWNLESYLRGFKKFFSEPWILNLEPKEVGLKIWRSFFLSLESWKSKYLE